MESSALRAEDGHPIKVSAWRPGTDAPNVVIQVLHGLGEYAARYDRFARACMASGFAVVAHDHRGHGSAAEYPGHFADRDGWDKVIGDVRRVQRWIGQDYPQVPVVLFGHSMGSYIAQSFALRHPGGFSQLILSASTYAARGELHAAHLLAALLSIVDRRGKSKLLNAMGFDAFNRPFEPARTGFDWLSRDAAEVDKYVADPLCGGPYTNRLWYDLTGGLLEITAQHAIAAVPTDIPILILGGQLDPVGGERRLKRLADVYRKTGHERVTLSIYAGGRHEMLNEINRDAVTSDILGWIREQLPDRDRN